LHQDKSMSAPEPQRHRRSSRLRQFLQTYKFEIAWLLIIGLGIFLVFERLNIRTSLIAWLRRLAGAMQHNAGDLGGVLDAFLARTTLSDAIGFVLILGALGAIVLRVRWRLLHNPALALLRCPKCNGNMHRVHRHNVDHIISFYVPVRRYRCTNDQCRWTGLRVGTGHGSSRTPARGRS